MLWNGAPSPKHELAAEDWCLSSEQQCHLRACVFLGTAVSMGLLERFWGDILEKPPSFFWAWHPDVALCKHVAWG